MSLPHDMPPAIKLNLPLWAAFDRSMAPTAATSGPALLRDRAVAVPAAAWPASGAPGDPHPTLGATDRPPRTRGAFSAIDTQLRHLTTNSSSEERFWNTARDVADGLENLRTASAPAARIRKRAQTLQGALPSVERVGYQFVLPCTRLHASLKLLLSELDKQAQAEPSQGMLARKRKRKEESVIFGDILKDLSGTQLSTATLRGAAPSPKRPPPPTMFMQSAPVVLLPSSHSAHSAHSARAACKPALADPLAHYVSTSTALVERLEAWQAGGANIDLLRHQAESVRASIVAVEGPFQTAWTPLDQLRARLGRLIDGVHAPSQAPSAPATLRDDMTAEQAAATARLAPEQGEPSDEERVFGEILNEPAPLVEAAPDRWALGLLRFDGID